KLLENIVAIHLYKQYGEALFYYNKNVEVDFVVPNAGLAIQVSYSLRDEQTRNREVNALVSLSRFMNISTALIISKDQEETIEQDGISIKVIPVWKWLAD
ncbi:MAG: ATP-binding protein, partial [Bacteroides cellulosilyticus]|nr:ATP-binding protein [Bacteroides cellulosilyticus]